MKREITNQNKENHSFLFDTLVKNTFDGQNMQGKVAQRRNLKAAEKTLNMHLKCSSGAGSTLAFYN